MKKDKLGQDIGIGSILAIPSKGYGSRINHIVEVVGYTGKGIRYVEYDYINKVSNANKAKYSSTSSNLKEMIVVSSLI